MLFKYDGFQLLYHFRVLERYVLVFVDVRFQIVKERLPFLHQELPVVHAYGYLVRFVELPIQEIVLFLLFLAQQGEIPSK